jgi:hypothetical protein
MKLVALLVVLAASIAAPRLYAQAPPETAAPAPAATEPVTPDAAATCPPSTTLEELVKALDDAVSGPANKDRTCMKALLLPEARLSPMDKSKGGNLEPHIETVDEWIDSVRKRGKMMLYERQVKVSSDTYGRIAHLWSTYELHIIKPEGKPYARGINSIQAVFDGTHWRVLEILWQAETSAEPVPEKYLP